MNTLLQLCEQARHELSQSPEQEAARQLTICNGCRYCEGFCAVFPAMTRRLTFGVADVHYMANLCHNCGACLHACQYAPPHEFAINVPRALAQVRVKTYADYAWPAPLGRLYQRNGLLLSLALAASLVLFLLVVAAQTPRSGGGAAHFYEVLGHEVLVALFGPVFGFALLALALGVRRFWREVHPVTSGMPQSAVASAQATHDALRLRYLGGGHGEGCNNEDDAFSLARARAHHLTFYGFMLCLAATSVATLYHYLWGWVAPYDWPSLPKVLGALGGVMLCTGTLGLLFLKLRRHPLQGDPAQNPMDYGFILLLLATSASGLLLWALRSHAWMPQALALHLGCVLALFVTLPYSKFAHGIFRGAALLRYEVEKRQPNRLGLGNE